MKKKQPKPSASPPFAEGSWVRWWEWYDYKREQVNLSFESAHPDKRGLGRVTRIQNGHRSGVYRIWVMNEDRYERVFRWPGYVEPARDDEVVAALLSYA